MPKNHGTMKTNIRKRFIEEIRKALSRTNNAAIYLTNQLGLGKETAYRRLRGSVPFTLDEAARLSRLLGISLDRLVGLSAEDADYAFSINYTKDFFENYEEFVSQSGRVLDIVGGDPHGLFIMAANHLPYCFYSPYTELMDFRLKRWIYEREMTESLSKKDSLDLSAQRRREQFELLNKYRAIEETHMIWDDSVLRSLVMEVRYFRMLSMLNDDEVAGIREELRNLLDRLEKMMITGYTPEGKRIYFYLSNVLFDTSYSYLEAGNFHVSYFHVYAMHMLQSESSEICSVQKKWLQAVLRHSTLITESGEIERTAYLKEQRAIIDAL